jgi:D-inositol-3-phosphate glycosyltransferase
MVTTDVPSVAREIRHVCMLSVHTCPLAMLGGKDTGGMNVYVRDLSRELTRRGVAVDVFTRSQDPHVAHVCPNDLGPGSYVYHVQAGPESPYDKRLVYQYLPEFISEVQRIAAEQGRRYDVIHSHYWLSGLVAQELRASWGRPFVHMFHTLGHLKDMVAQRPEDHEPPVRMESEAAIMRAADRLVAASPLEKSQMATLYGADPCKVEVISPGVDLTLFYPRDSVKAKVRLGLCPDRHVVLFVGRIEPLKGIDTLLRAMALVTQQIPGWRDEVCVAIIGGDASVPTEALDAEMARLHRLRLDLGLEDLVTFLGARAQDSLPDYYSVADVVVMPSHYESFGMVALEAMACGTPVVASRVGGLAYTVLDGVTGLHVPERDPDALGLEIVRLIQNPTLRERLGRQAQQVAQCYGWPAITDRIVDLYSDMVRGRDPCSPRPAE